MKPNDAISSIEALAGSRIVANLTGGPASDSYVVERDDERFVLRIDNDIAAGLGLDRTAEARVLDYVSRQEIAPSPIFSDPERGVLVTRYIEGDAWRENDVRESRRISRLAALLKRLHGLEPVGEPIDLLDKIERYSHVIATVEGRSIARAATQLVTALDGSAVATVLCHNDLTCANIIDGDELMLIDWEYAAVGDPLFDLALVAEHHQFESNETGTLLRAYFGNVQGADVRRFKHYRKLYECIEWLWMAAVETLSGTARS